MYKRIVQLLTKRAEEALNAHQGYISAIKMLKGLQEGVEGAQEGTKGRGGRRTRPTYVKYTYTCLFPPCGAKFTARRAGTKWCPEHRSPQRRTATRLAMASKQKPQGVVLLPGDALSKSKGGRNGDRQQ